MLGVRVRFRDSVRVRVTDRTVLGVRVRFRGCVTFRVRFRVRFRFGQGCLGDLSRPDLCLTLHN